MNYFEELAAKYDAWFKTSHGQYVYRYEREIIMGLAGIKPGMKVADIGCGTGIYTREFLNAGCEVTGLDISPEMLAIAAHKNKDFDYKVSFLEGDARTLPFADGSFERVISVTAMEFFEEPRECLQEMYRILQPGGRMVVATLNSLSLWSLQRRFKACLKKTIFSGTTFYSIYNLRQMLKPIEISEWRGSIFIPPFFPEILIRNPDGFERWGQRNIPAFGTFIAVRVDK